MPVVQAIANTDVGMWGIDADEYTEANIERLLEQAQILRRANGTMSDTLVTKVTLGVFGSVPAFDTNVGRGLKRVLGVSGLDERHSAGSPPSITRTQNCLTVAASRRWSSCLASPPSGCTREPKSSTWPSSSRECPTLLANQRTAVGEVCNLPTLACPWQSHFLRSLAQELLRNIGAMV